MGPAVGPARQLQASSRHQSIRRGLKPNPRRAAFSSRHAGGRYFGSAEVNVCGAEHRTLRPPREVGGGAREIPQRTSERAALARVHHAAGRRRAGRRRRSSPQVVAAGRRRRSSPRVVAAGRRRGSSPCVAARAPLLRLGGLGEVHVGGARGSVPSAGRSDVGPRGSAPSFGQSRQVADSPFRSANRASREPHFARRSRLASAIARPPQAAAK